MLILHAVSYRAQGIPKGCRKARTLEFSTDIAVDIPETIDAPVVMEVCCTDRRWNDERQEHEEAVTWRPYRAHGGRLWVQAGLTAADAGPVIASRAVDQVQAWSHGAHEAEYIIQRESKAWADGHLVIDAEIWEPADEPFLVIEDLHYHAGTYLAFRTENHQASRIDDGAVFRLDELDAALAEVERLNKDLSPRRAGRLEREHFDFSDHVRLLRPDLLSRPTRLAYQAQVRYIAVLERVHRAQSSVADLVRALDDLRSSFALAPVPAGCDAPSVNRLFDLLHEAETIMSERSLTTAANEAAA